MKIIEIAIENFRGIKTEQKFPLNSFSSIVGKNDSGKSIVLNAIASYLNLKEYPISVSDFNDTASPIIITCTFISENITGLLESKIKSKIKKADGLDEFIAGILPSGHLTIRKTINSAKKSFDSEKVLMVDYVPDDFAFLYGKSDDDLNTILSNNGITIPVQGTGRNSKLEIVLCKRTNGSIYETYNTNGKDAFISAIVDELGIKPSYNLRDNHEKIVFVDSHNDAHFFNLICRNLIDRDLLQNEKILV
ncbi:XisH protein domain-conaining protein [Desulfonema limicola]|uniref:XisH protein domain-conaining protein n=1 Tax=Desulfonema limicola TaxID=45656 RepID=A0A975GHH9_9BACT|nr:AAA family ATPase [Desulfonema limicola]QTA81480.1 XisH protein domain-conaining protein [Desulfonema limicola]